MMSSHLVLRLIPPRPTFSEDMTDEERAIMTRHVAHWQPQLDAGRLVAFGPVAGEGGAWDPAILEAESEAEARALARADPAATSGLGRYEVGRLVAGFVRPRVAA